MKLVPQLLARIAPCGWLLCCLLINPWSPAVAAQSTLQGVDQVLVNKDYSASDPRYKYVYELLQKILFATQPKYGQAMVSVSKTTMSRDRIFSELMRGDKIHLMAEAPKIQWDQNLLRVPIPLRKGIQGHRLFLIDQSSRAKMSELNDLNDLMALPTGSGNQWSTRVAMQGVGFNIVTSTHYDGLFGMLMAGRFVTFGRGINEAYREQRLHQQKYPDVVVDDQVLLSLPLPTFFYITPTRPRLAERIEEGMQHLMASGEFEDFFLNYHCRDLVEARAHQRKRFRISNPLVSDQWMRDNDQYWLDMSQDFSAQCAPYLRS